MYNPEMTNQERLEEVYRLTVENNHLLHKIQNRERIAFIVRALYWLALLGVLGGVYYYIRPIFEALAGGTATGFLDRFQGNIEALMNAVQNGGDSASTASSQ